MLILEHPTPAAALMLVATGGVSGLYGVCQLYLLHVPRVQAIDRGQEWHISLGSNPSDEITKYNPILIAFSL